jgi:AcrR family transcriptional regulator
MRVAAARSRATRHEQGQASILEAAARFIATQGFHGMSMRDLARATGKAPASLYNYFSSKDELLFALQAGSFQELIEDAEEAMATATTPSAKLHAFIANHVAYVVDHPEVMRVLVHEAASLPPPRRRSVRALKEHYFELAGPLVAALLREGRGARKVPAAEERATVERSTYALFGMLNWIYSWYRPERHGSPAVLARTLHSLAVGGLREVCAGEERP